jgi:hypothetical protein
MPSNKNQNNTMKTRKAINVDPSAASTLSVVDDDGLETIPSTAVNPKKRKQQQQSSMDNYINSTSKLPKNKDDITSRDFIDTKHASNKKVEEKIRKPRATKTTKNNTPPTKTLPLKSASTTTKSSKLEAPETYDHVDDESDYLMEIRTARPDSVKKVIEIISPLLTDAVIRFLPDGNYFSFHTGHSILKQ